MKKYYCYGKQTESTLHFMLMQREDEVDYKLVDFIFIRNNVCKYYKYFKNYLCLDHSITMF